MSKTLDALPSQVPAVAWRHRPPGQIERDEEGRQDMSKKCKMEVMSDLAADEKKELASF